MYITFYDIYVFINLKGIISNLFMKDTQKLVFFFTKPKG